MNEIETISFLEMFETCVNFVNDPNDAEKGKAMDDLKKKIVIRGFLPMQEKVVLLYKILMSADKPFDLAAPAFTSGLEIAMVVDGLLAYTNVEHEIPQQVKIYEVYDVLYQSGLADFIIGYCRHDHDRLQTMLDRSFAISNLRELVDTLENMSIDSIRESLDEFKKFYSTVDPVMVKNIADIVRYNDPTLYQVKEDVIDKALEKLEKIDTLEKMTSIKFAEDTAQG